MKILKKMTPLMLATMIIAPSILVDSVLAQRSGERPRNGDDRIDNPAPESLNSVGERGTLRGDQDFRNWDKRYIGAKTFNLNDDQEIAQTVRAAEVAHKELINKTTLLTKKESELKVAETESKAINKVITSLNSAIVKAVTEKNKLQKTIPTKRNELKELNTQLQLANSAAQTTATDLAKIEENIVTAQEELKVIEDQCSANPAANCQAKITRSTNKLEKVKAPLANAKRLDKAAKQNVTSRTRQRNAKRTEIADTNTQISTLETQNTNRTNQLNIKQREVSIANTKVNTAKQALTPVRRMYSQALTNRNSKIQRRDDLKTIIIQRIIRINGIGANAGEDAGSIDGDYYAELLGVENGQIDGDRDGENEGTRVGQDRSHRSGVTQGEIQGISQASIDGESDGSREGTSAAHIAVATREGRSSGTQRANSSDAAKIGIAQGKQDGSNRAQATGNRTGTALGEKQAIEQNEKNLNSNIQIDGPFAGAFAARVPDYPGFDCISHRGRRYVGDDYGWRNQNDWRAESNCPNFKPQKHSELARTNRPILQKAFMDGYIRTYRQSKRDQFVRSIDRYYLSTYDNVSSAAYQNFSNREFPIHREQGRISGYNASYNARYPIMREQFYQSAYDSTRTSPNRSSSEYTSTFSSVEASTYRSKYEAIRVANYQRIEQETFDLNIEEQIEKFRDSRFTAVDNVYAKNSVLKYISSTISDGGINGIAKADGVYQPGEITLHNITLKNFGKVAATNVTVRMEDGSSTKLPSIPANSTVTIKGAASSSIMEGSIGSIHKSELEVFSPLTAEDSIQGRHFYATSTGKLNSSDSKNLTRAYPMTLAGLQTDSELLINQRNSMQLNVSNQSKRPYTGKMTVELSVESNTNIITSQFDDINSLKNSITLKSAQILVASERDVYRPLVFTAKLVKNGVTLGVLSNSYRTMAKAPYTDKSNKPVIVVDSDKNPGTLLEVLSDLRGLSNASVLDLSLESLNSKILRDGLDKKSILVLDDTRGSSITGVNSLLRSTEDSSMIFVDARSTGLELAKRNAPHMKSVVKLTNRLKGLSTDLNLYYTNQWLDGVKDITVVAQATRANFIQTMNAMKAFNKTNAEYVAESGTALTKSNWSTTHPTVQAMISMAAGQIMAVSSSMDRRETTELVDLMKSDKLLFQKILRAPGDKKVKNSNLSKQLASIAMWHVLDKGVDSFDDLKDKIHHRIESRLEDEMKDVMQGNGIRIFSKGTYNYLKSFDKGLYNSIDANKYAQSPFRL